MIMHSRQYPIITEMADIDDYEAFKGYAPVSAKPFDSPEISVFSVTRFLYDVARKRRKCPFAAEGAELLQNI